jgi:tRNA (cytidine/uridine-2'-O-)-methyltransferase
LARKVPNPPLNVVLVEPQIPPNTGNVARLCAASGCHLILVGRLGFDLSEPTLKRAGLDYWDYVSWEHRPDLETFLADLAPRAFHLLSARAATPYTLLPAAWGDHLLFGCESEGLPKWLLERHPGQCYTVPMAESRVRSLNLSSAVAIVTYDALRRLKPF